MEKRKAASVFDNIFLVVGIWLISYLWTRYYVMNLLVAMIAASGIAMCVIMLINFRRKKNKLLQKKQKHIDTIMNQFLYGGKDFSLDFLFSALKNKFDADSDLRAADELHNEKNDNSKIDGSTLRENEDLSNTNKKTKKETQAGDGFVIVGATAIFPKFSPLPLNLEQLIECFTLTKKLGAKSMIILTLNGLDKLSKQCLPRLPEMKINIFDKNKCYDFLGWLGSFPEVIFEPKPQKPSIKKLAAAALSPKKFKHYLIISLVLMISSYFVMYSIYYIVFASLTLTLAVLSKINIMKKFTKNKT